jgi:ankyrin repeat protein
LYPDGLQAVNEEGLLPLHWAAAKNRNVRIVAHMVEMYPDALNQVNHEHALPLHAAAQNSFLDVVKFIYQQYPGAISRLDSDAGLPFHIACSLNSNIDVVKFLYSMLPSAISTVQDYGVLPLHLACSQNPKIEILQFLLSTYPDAVRATDDQRWLPLHCVVNNKQLLYSTKHYDFIQMIVKAYPEAVTIRNGHGDLHTPYDSFCILHASDQIKRLLLKASPDLDIDLYHELNWEARRAVVLLFMRLTQRIAQESITVMSIPSPSSSSFRKALTPHEPGLKKSFTEDESHLRPHRTQQRDKRSRTESVGSEGLYEQQQTANMVESKQNQLRHKTSQETVKKAKKLFKNEDLSLDFSTQTHPVFINSEYNSNHHLPPSGRQVQYLGHSVRTSVPHDQIVYYKLAELGGTNSKGCITHELIRSIISFL